jgi:hypothetical protein
METGLLVVALGGQPGSCHRRGLLHRIPYHGCGRLALSEEGRLVKFG